MTVKELIQELLDMPMGADVVTEHCTIEHKDRPVKSVVRHGWAHGDNLNGVVVLYDVTDPDS